MKYAIEVKVMALGRAGRPVDERVARREVEPLTSDELDAAVIEVAREAIERMKAS